MSSLTVSDAIWVGHLRWLWPPYRRAEDRDIAVGADSMMKRSFARENCQQQSADAYLALVRGNYRRKPDITQSFSGRQGSFGVCYSCEREPRGLHLHSFSNDRGLAEDVLRRVERKVTGPALRLVLLRNRIPQLTFNHKFTVFSAAYSIIATIVGLTSTFPLGAALLEPVKVLLGITIILSFIYFIGVLCAMFALYYYQMRLVWFA